MRYVFVNRNMYHKASPVKSLLKLLHKGIRVFQYDISSDKKLNLKTQ
jgi:hypothetical protein